MNGTCLLKEERETLAMILRQEGQLSRSQGMKNGRGQSHLSESWIALAYKLSLTPYQELTGSDVWLLGMLALSIGDETTWTQLFVVGA